MGEGQICDSSQKAKRSHTISILYGSPGRHSVIMFLHCLNRTIDPETVKEG